MKTEEDEMIIFVFILICLSTYENFVYLPFLNNWSSHIFSHVIYIYIYVYIYIYIYKLKYDLSSTHLLLLVICVCVFFITPPQKKTRNYTQKL